MDTKQAKQTDALERWDWLWNTAFYGLVTRVGRPHAFRPQRHRAALVALAADGRHAGLALGRSADHQSEQPAPDDRPILRFIIIVGDILLWFALVNMSPAYYLALFGLFGQVFRHLTIRYAVAAIIYPDGGDNR